MAKKKFKDLTPAEKYTRLNKQGYSLLALKWVSILSPYLIIGAVNFDEYFQEANGWKMSIGCILALIVAGIAIKNETKDNTRINGLVGWAVAFALILCFQSILQDLALIVGCGLIGQIVGAGFELGSDTQLEKARLYRNAQINAEANGKEV